MPRIHSGRATLRKRVKLTLSRLCSARRSARMAKHPYSVV
jgi:hypothetical protein